MYMNHPSTAVVAGNNYKRSVIMAYGLRAVMVCSSWQALHEELKHIGQMLTYDDYSNSEFDLVTSKISDRFLSNQKFTNLNFINNYRNTFTEPHKKD